jgi:hypothetical protein
MAQWADVARCAARLPELVDADDRHDWRVRGKPVAWERPLRQMDQTHLGATAPTGPILGVRVPDLDTKDVRLSELHPAVFVTPHFDGYPAVLVDLESIDADDLAELLIDAWRTQAPKRVVAAWRLSEEQID